MSGRNSRTAKRRKTDSNTFKPVEEEGNGQDIATLASSRPPSRPHSTGGVAPPLQAIAVESSLGFKNEEWIGKARNRKKKTMRNLKAIISASKFKEYPPSVPTYTSIDAALSLRPAKKYCDISGLPTTYTDPRTRMRYFSPVHYSYIQSLSNDLVEEYLEVRKANITLR